MELKFEEYLKNGRSRLKASDIQTLILWVLAEAINPKWLFIKVGQRSLFSLLFGNGCVC